MVPAKYPEATEPELNAFLRGHRVLAVRKEFVSDGENSYWTFCVEYLNSPNGAMPGPPKGPKVDYREVLKPQEFEVFSRVRDWRKSTAEREGVPVYTIFTNEQIAAMVRGRVSSKAQLKAIDGVGDARVDKYAEAVLEKLVFNPVPG